jgi:Cu(I)/Ag(I) efflux system periplasmic protein CusF
MQKAGLMIAGLSAFALGVAACSPKTEEPAATAPSPAAAPMADMPMNTTTPAVTGPITAVGKVTAIDAAAGKITLDHQAIPAVNWDAMTMQFTATDPIMLKDLKVGDTVQFELKSAAEKTLIVKIQKQ